MRADWDEARVAELTRHWASGDSAGIIARAMQTTRNAILGKVNRLGLESRRDSQPRRVIERCTGLTTVKKKTFRAAPIVRSSVVQEMRLRCLEIIPRNISLLDLTEQDCRYIAGEDYLYCGHPKMAGSSYCVPHNFLVWEKPRAPLKRRDAA